MVREEYEVRRNRILEAIDGMPYIDGLVVLCDMLAAVIANATKIEGNDSDNVIDALVPILKNRASMMRTSMESEGALQ